MKDHPTITVSKQGVTIIGNFITEEAGYVMSLTFGAIARLVVNSGVRIKLRPHDSRPVVCMSSEGVDFYGDFDGNKVSWAMHLSWDQVMKMTKERGKRLTLADMGRGMSRWMHEAHGEGTPPSDPTSSP